MKYIIENDRGEYAVFSKTSPTSDIDISTPELLMRNTAEGLKTGTMAVHWRTEPRIASKFRGYHAADVIVALMRLYPKIGTPTAAAAQV